MDKRFLAILAGIVIIFGVVFAASQHSSNTSGNSNTSNAQPTSHIEGQGSTSVKLVEYGDYECPVCSLYYPVVKQVAAQFNSQVYFQFRNLPLTSLHKNAFAAARAAEAASLQGKFWQMHDELYSNQDPTGQSGWVASDNPLTYFTAFVQQIGLNINQFKTDYASDKVNNAINADLAAFAKTGQQEATPTYFLDGKYIPNTELADPTTGEPSASLFAKVINAEITAKTRQ
ncbi:MAG: thioredoxin domain-containing protein [Candidatus Saccharimonadales bacterium]|jgi:protein-disulfide isomerase